MTAPIDVMIANLIKNKTLDAYGPKDMFFTQNRIDVKSTLNAKHVHPPQYSKKK